MALVRTLVLAVCYVVSCVVCFNVDVENYVRHTGEPGSMFGFSVAEHSDRGVSWILVGAPEAQTRQPGVTRGGAVFRCDVNREFTCQPVPFDTSGNNNNSAKNQIDKKSDQWFGATVRSSGADGVILACAPRYVWFSTTGPLNRREPVGTCFVGSSSFSDFVEYSPCRTRNFGYNRQGSCQAGLGAAVSKNGDRLYIGAVGSWYWQGQLIDISSRVRPPPEAEEYAEPGQVFSQSLRNRQAVQTTREGPAEDDDSYLGYSVTSGVFDSSGEPGVAVGMPRGEGLLGKVVLYTWEMKNTQNITGEQLGAYFAYAICTADVDGDGHDDLIIGAPLFTDRMNNKDNYENGRIYVVYQGVENKFARFVKRDGKNSKARFGLSLTSLGDINMDGYGDFAVGAPYDGVEERGAVYIYHGSITGVEEKPAQVILAEEIQPDLTTFGFSLSGGLDMDNNQYPDIIVGAYESETAVLLKTRPVVKITSTLNFNAQSKLISLKERNCTTRDRTAVPCLELRGCIEYDGVGVDPRLDFEIQFLLDTKKTHEMRMFFLDHEGRSSQNYSIVLNKGAQFCKTELIYIKSSIRDKLTPLEAELRYSLRSSLVARPPTVAYRRVIRSLQPILDQSVAAYQKDSINIEKNCGKDNICIPDLKLIAKPSVTRYLLGSGERFEVDVVVENNGEDAFEATYNLQIPPGMNYVKVERIDDFERDIPVQCSPPSSATNNTLKCDIGNPLPKRKLVHFKVLLSPFHRSDMKSRYDFTMDVNTTNPELAASIADNTHTMSIPIWVQTEHLVSGYSYPNEVSYNLSQYRSDNVSAEHEIGPQVVHVYNIKNQGPSDIVQAEAFFVWTAETKDGHDLLYLLEQPQVSGNVRCEEAPLVNRHGALLDLTSNRKTVLEYHGLAYEANTGGSSVTSLAGSATSSHTSSSGSSSSTSHSSSSSSSSSSSRTASTSSTDSSSGSRTSVAGSSSGSRTSSAGSSSGSRTNTATALAEEERLIQEEERRIREQENLGKATGSSVTHGSGRVQTTAPRNQGSGYDRIATSTVHYPVGNIPEESGSYQGGIAHGRGSTGTSILEEDYGKFNGGGGRGGGGGRATSSEDTRTYSQSGGRSYNQGRSGTFDSSRSHTQDETRQGGGRTLSRADGRTTVDEARTYGGSNDYAVGGSRTHGHGGHTSTHDSKEEESGSIYGDIGRGRIDGAGIASGSRTYEQSGSRSREHELRREQAAGRQGGSGGVLDLGSGTRTYQQSHNFTATVQENDETPRSFSNYSYSSSKNGRNTSGGWQSGDEDLNAIGGHVNLGLVGAGHSVGSHESTRTVYRSGYNVGNPSSGERAETRGNVGEDVTISTSGSRPRHRNIEPGFEEEQQLSANLRQRAEGGARRRDERRRTEERIDGGKRRAEEGVDKGRQRAEETSSSETKSRSSAARERGVKDGDNNLEDVADKFQLYKRFERSVSDMEDRDDEVNMNRRRSLETEARWGRSKEEAAENGPSAARQASDSELDRLLDCAVAKCAVVKCTVGPLKSNEEVFVGFRYRVWIRTLEKISWNNPVKLSSLVAARVTKLPHVGEPFEMKLKSAEIPLEVFPSEVPVRPDIVPMWVVVLSACAGALILLLLIFLLYKCGFFKRQRPPESAETQPLNRNGHYNSGDEAL